MTTRMAYLLQLHRSATVVPSGSVVAQMGRMSQVRAVLTPWANRVEGPRSVALAVAPGVALAVDHETILKIA